MAGFDPSAEGRRASSSSATRAPPHAGGGGALRRPSVSASPEAPVEGFELLDGVGDGEELPPRSSIETPRQPRSSSWPAGRFACDGRPHPDGQVSRGATRPPGRSCSPSAAWGPTRRPPPIRGNSPAITMSSWLPLEDLVVGHGNVAQAAVCPVARPLPGRAGAVRGRADVHRSGDSAALCGPHHATRPTMRSSVFGALYPDQLRHAEDTRAALTGAADIRLRRCAAHPAGARALRWADVDRSRRICTPIVQGHPAPPFP